MFRFFDFVYLEAANWYKNESGSKWSGSTVVSMFQSFNILSVILLLQHYLGFFITSKLFVIILAIALMVYNDRRYLFQKSNSYEEISKRWEELTFKEMDTTFNRVIFYMVASTVVFFGIAIFVGRGK